eukprot:TRINITY_DN7077_c0_g1_i3.p1 TRINITY_DN7077_c0_g1~~TRINITY_DN7077_c0_g1_i3.p1  ORF type:complete len:541 (-),score=175.75 TRINITY_DN7077_c0_g1_i3:203-1825(-)
MEDLSPNNLRDHYGMPIGKDHATEYEKKKDHYTKNAQKMESEWKNLVVEKGLSFKLQKDSKNIFRLAKKGVPKSVRPEIWMILTGAQSKKNNADKNSGDESYYNQLVRKNLSASKPLKAAESIEKDLRRTFPGHDVIDTEEGQERLRKILSAFARRNKEVGYCQAMNFVTAWLMLQMGDEDAFWMLTTIVEDICSGYYATNMIGIRVDIAVVKEILASHLPKIDAKMEELSVILSLVSVKWFLPLFIHLLPSETLLRFWDNLFLDGSFIFRLVLAIFKINEADLLRQKDAIEFTQRIEHHMARMFDPQQLIEEADSFKDVNMELIEKLRQKHKTEIEREIEELNQRRAISQLSKGSRFSITELKELYDQFKAITAKSGEIDLPNFQRIFYNVFPDRKGDDVNVAQLFQQFDVDGSKTIDFRELVTGFSILTRGTPDEKLEFAFKAYDSDKSGFIERAELEQMIRGVYKHLFSSEKVDPKQISDFCDAIYSNLDTNHDGKLSFEEFKQIAVVDPRLCHCFFDDVEEGSDSVGIEFFNLNDR